jgi:hypothetical protein
MAKPCSSAVAAINPSTTGNWIPTDLAVMVRLPHRCSDAQAAPPDRNRSIDRKDPQAKPILQVLIHRLLKQDDFFAVRVHVAR